MKNLYIVLSLIVIALVAISIININNKNMNSFKKVYYMGNDIDSSSLDFLRSAYGAKDVSVVENANMDKILDLVSKEIIAPDSLKPENYNVQVIGFEDQNSSKIYIGLWCGDSVKIDFEKEIVSNSVLDGGNCYIDAVYDIEQEKIVHFEPHGEA